MSPTQKEKLKSICEAPGHRPGSKSSRKKVTFSGGNDMAKNFDAVTRQISALTSLVELLAKKLNGNEEHSDSDSDSQSGKSSSKAKSSYSKALSRKK